MGRTYFKGKTIGVDIPLGGDEGQFLAKKSDADDDFEWGSVSGDISPTSDAPVSSKAVAEALETKVDKEEGKGLSTEDFTSEEKEKLDNIDLSDYVPTSSIGVADGVASLDANGRVPYSQLPVSAMEFKGTWNASTNTPTLVSGEGDSGDFYIVSVGGTWNGIIFNANDRIIFDGVTAHDWVKLVAGEVNSVNGQSGQVQLDADDIPYDNNTSVEDKLTELDSDKADTVNGISVVNGEVTVNAGDIPFDNTDSGMSATDVDGAIKEAYAHGGHKIYDESGTQLTQRDNLQFVGLGVSDASNKTIVQNPVFTGTTAEWTAVTDKSKYKIVNLTDDGETGEVVDAVTDGDMRPVTSNAVADLLSVDGVSKSNNTISANDVSTIVIDVSKANKTPLGIVGVATSGSSYDVVSNFYISGNNANIRIKNTTSASINVTVSVRVLYKNV